MEQPNTAAKRVYQGIIDNLPTKVAIPGTRRKVSIRGMRPYTIERLTRLWLERDASIEEESSEILRSLCTAPYFSVKQAVLMTLNSYWSIRLFYGLKWRVWAYLRGYTESQMMPIITEGKKKLPLMAHWTNMAYSVDMRNDWMKMTSKEAELYRAELLSVASRLSSRNSQSTEAHEDSSSDS